jgi:outer membrane receptor for monomeric catechols
MRGSLLGRASVLGATLLCACSAHPAPKTDVSSPDVQTTGGATILTAAVLQKQSRSLLDVLKARIPSITVIDGQPCPDVYLRGRSTISTSSNPAIYVDGERANNTCVLDMMNVTDLERVEVYSNGQPRAGYKSDPYGVILIFVKTSD